jgi:hypothetical protein
MGACIDNPLGPDPGISWKWSDPAPSSGCPGSVGGASASAAAGSQLGIKASVKGEGRRRSLRFRLSPAAGQRVTFAEEAARVYRTIGSTDKGRGTLGFRPAPGPGGKRSIVAIVEQNGVPYEKATIARYKAPPMRPLRRPRHVKVKRRGRKLVVGWSRVKGARGYQVLVALPRDGRRLLFFPPPKKRSLRVRGVERSDIARVSVTAVGTDLRPGRTAKAKLGPRKVSRRR